MLAALALEIMLAIYAGTVILGSMSAVQEKRSYAEEENVATVAYNFLYSGYEDRDSCIPANGPVDYSKAVDGLSFKKEYSNSYSLVPGSKGLDSCDIAYDAGTKSLYVRTGSKRFSKSILGTK